MNENNWQERTTVSETGGHDTFTFAWGGVSFSIEAIQPHKLDVRIKDANPSYRIKTSEWRGKV